MPGIRTIAPRRKVLYLLIVLGGLLALVEGGWRLLANRRLANLEQVLQERNAFFEEDIPCRQLLRPGDWSADEAPDGSPAYRFHVNTMKIRGPEIIPEKPDGTYRVLCLGGSTTFGSGCYSDSDTYPAQLGRLLEKRCPKITTEVLNGGVPGYGTTESYFNLRRLLPIEPDVVIVYHAINDIAWSEELGEFYFDPDSRRRPLSRLERCRVDAGSFFVEALFRRLAGTRERRARELRDSVPTRQATGFRDNLVRIVETARAHHAEVVLATFATQIAPDWGPERVAMVERQTAFQVTRLRYEALSSTVERYNAVIRSVARALATPLVEVAGHIPSDDEHWTDFVHMNEEGSRAMARLMVKPVAKILRERRAAREMPGGR